MDDAGILRPKVLILPVESPCPNISGASVKGQLNISGADLYFCSDTAGTWKVVTST